LKKITKEQIQSLPILRFEGEIRLVNQEKDLHECMEILGQSDTLGFDTEKRPSFRKGEKYHPSLIQLSTTEVACVFQVGRMGFHPGIMSLLENPAITKVGVAVKDDLDELRAFRDYQPAG
jgi:hypothetical protein